MCASVVHCRTNSCDLLLWREVNFVMSAECCGGRRRCSGRTVSLWRDCSTCRRTFYGGFGGSVTSVYSENSGTLRPSCSIVSFEEADFHRGRSEDFRTPSYGGT